jgi:putative transposase
MGDRRSSTRTRALEFTSELFTGLLQEAGIQISMDGRGRWLDNVFVERLWRSLKYEEVYLKAYETVAEARRGIGLWFEFYNSQRPHQALDRLTPDEVYAGLTSLPEAA